jgi:hypothetical protein
VKHLFYATHNSKEREGEKERERERERERDERKKISFEDRKTKK